MAQISWGKPRIFIGPKGALSSTAVIYTELNTPVEDSTNLTATAGDKTEATIEGGEAEATKSKAATYELTMNVRMAKSRKLPAALQNTDANADGKYTKGEVAVILQPEDSEAPGFFIQNASVSVVESYTSADGAIWEITFYPNKPASGDTIVWGTVSGFSETSEGSGDAAYKNASFTSSNVVAITQFHDDPND